MSLLVFLVVVPTYVYPAEADSMRP